MYKNLYAESTFVCPSYWLAEAFTDKSRAAYRYQFSVPVAFHGIDLLGYFGPAIPTYGPDFEKAFMSTSSFHTLARDYFSSPIEICRLQTLLTHVHSKKLYGATSSSTTTLRFQRPSPTVQAAPTPRLRTRPRYGHAIRPRSPI